MAKQNSAKLDKWKPKIKLWLEYQDEAVFGGGRLTLLQAIQTTGSISQAAKQLGMSYRAAWGKIKATEERLGIKLLETHTGGHRSGAELTPEAIKLLLSFRRFKDDADEMINQLFVQYFEELFS